MNKKDHDSSGKRNEKHDVKKTSKNNRNKIIAIGIAAAIVAITVFFSLKSYNNIATNDISVIDGIKCETTEYSVFHVHAHLDVFINGNPFTVPAFIGIKDKTCLYWLHTHSTDGIIHIESPEPRSFTIGEFLDIWKSTGSVIPPSDEPTIYQNGQLVNATLKDIPLNAHDEIVLVYGQPPSNIPSSFQFPAGV